MSKTIENAISINTPLTKVWEYLTTPSLMSQWMGEPEMNIRVHTDWFVGNHISIKGIHHIPFENKGTVLECIPQKVLQYTHLSSISGLSDSKENYTLITFLLAPEKGRTILTVRIENFPTKSIYKHMDFYWRGTITILKNLIERQ